MPQNSVVPFCKQKQNHDSISKSALVNQVYFCENSMLKFIDTDEGLMFGAEK